MHRVAVLACVCGCTRVCDGVHGVHGLHGAHLLEVLVERVVVLLQEVGAAIGDVPRKVAHLCIAK